MNRGKVWDEAGEHQKAVADYSETVRINPNFPFGYSGRGLAWHKQGEHDKAIADFTEALRIDPKLAVAYVSRGIAWHSKGEQDRALADYDEAIRLDPASAAFAFGNRGRILSHRGRHERAIADLKAALALNLEDPQIYNSLAWLLATCPDARLRDGKGAVEYATKACELDQWNDAGDLDTLASAYAESGDFDAAFKWQQKAVAMSSGTQLTDRQSRLDLYVARKAYRTDAQP